MNRLAQLLFVLFLSNQALGHSRLKSSGNLPPRSNNPGLKTAPCGGIARTTTPTELAAGATITVEWEETINHPGRFEFYFSKDDSTFVKLKTVEDTQNDAVVGGAYHQFSVDLTLPTTNCEACTIQMIQVMTENPTNPSFYYSCADIKLTGAAETNDPVPTDPEDPKENPSEKTNGEGTNTETDGSPSCH